MGAWLGRDLAANTAGKNARHGPVITNHCVNVGLNPFPFVDFPPINLITGVDDDVLKQDSLSATIAFSEGMNNIEVAKKLSHGANEVRAFKPFEPVGLCQCRKQLVGLRLNARNGTEAGIRFGNVNGTKLAGPGVDILEQMPVDLLQIRKVIGREFEINFAGGNLA